MASVPVNKKNMNTIQKLRSLELYLATHPDCEENSECADRLSDVQELLKEIPDPTEQLQADKAELLEALGISLRLNKAFGANSEWIEVQEIESLIQKMKKRQENTPR